MGRRSKNKKKSLSPGTPTNPVPITTMVGGRQVAAAATAAPPISEQVARSDKAAKGVDKEVIEKNKKSIAKHEKKLLNDLEDRYPEVKARMSLREQGNRRHVDESNSPPRQHHSSSSSPRRRLGSSTYKPLSKERRKELEFGWKQIDTVGSVPPSDYTITSISQNHDLLRLDENKMVPNMKMNSRDWLEAYSLETMNLTLKDLLAKGVVSKPITDKSGKAVQNIRFEASLIDEFEYKLNLALEMFSKRIKWLLQSSRKQFGLIQGDRVAVLVDSSNSNMGFGRAIEIQDSLLTLIDEQLAVKKQLYFISYGSDIDELWEDSLMDVHHRTLEEAKLFITKLEPSGGSNMIKALKRALFIRGLDCVVLIVGSVPDQNMEILSDFMHQALINKPASLHCVSYELNNHIVNDGLKKLANETNGSYHCFSNSNEEAVYSSTDVNLLLKEIQKVQEMLNKIKEMRKGMLGSALIQIENEVSLELEKFPQTQYLPRPRGHDLPLRVHTADTAGRTSKDWIERHGLKAKKLNLYQVLAPNAYSNMEDYVPILNKSVQSQVLEKAMVQFIWHDGTVKNLHVDLATLYDFQNRLKEAVKLYEKRIEWISSDSRKIFGTIAEDSLIVLIDLSQANQNYLIHIQHSLRLLMEEQIVNKKLFNIIGFGRTIRKWRPTVVKPTSETLQDAWKWVLGLRCEGTRNVLGALKEALENEEEIKHNIHIEGIYLFTSGIPDQSTEVLCSYVEEASCGTRLHCHTILFNVDDYDVNGPIPGRWANITKTAESLRQLAHCCDGRFHWFREIGIIESDDIKLIQQEIDKAVEFSKKAFELVNKIKPKSTDEIADEEGSDNEEYFYLSDGEGGRSKPKPLPPPKPTALSLQRQQLKEKELEDARDKLIEANKQKMLPWRPNSSGGKEGRSLTRSNSASSSKHQVKASTEPFYLGDKSNSKGVVFSKYASPSPKLGKKPIPIVTIVDKEENLTTKEWLKRYSLIKLKLDLHKLVAGPECRHDTINIGAMKKEVSARYCSIFPSININGTVRHLHLKPGELLEYQQQCEKVLLRYLKRLQWLLSGSRRLFGTFVHEKCAILIDTSGSMNDYMAEVRRELASLVWEQLFKFKIKFNLIRFADRCEKWRDGVQEASEDNCHKAISWLACLNATGNSCTLDAIMQAFADPEITAIYLITDGKPDNSTTMVLDEVRRMNTNRRLSINTISFNCDEKSANEFLKQLSTENYGRFHRSSKTDTDIHLFAHKIITEGFQEAYLSHIPDFESDDLKRLANEINKAKQYLKQSIAFYRMYDKREKTEDMLIGPMHLNQVKESSTRHKGCVPVDFLL